MPITRAKASSLLNQKEMALYDDSRINGLRQLDARGLASRIKRARTARDRARDLVQKHKLASRASTGSKRGSSGQANQRSKDKAELMAEILQRFEGRLKDVEREAAPAKSTSAGRATKKPAASKTSKQAAKNTTAPTAARAGKAATKKTSTAKSTSTAKKASTAKKPSTAKKTAPARKTASTAGKRAGAGPAGASASTGTRAGSDRNAKRTTTARQPATGASPAKKSATAGASRKRAGGKASRKRRITPEQALAQTQALLEAKHAQDAAPKPWQDAPGGGLAEGGHPGYQSDAARRRALRLHQAEARIPAIQGSVSTRDRINQGKRDHRGDDNGD